MCVYKHTFHILHFGQLQNEDDKEDQDTRNFELTEARIDVLLGKDETIDLPKLKGISHSDLQNKIATVAAKNNALTSVKRDIVRKDPEIYDDSGEIIEDDWNNLPLAPETLRQEVVDKYKNEIENYTYNYRAGRRAARPAGRPSADPAAAARTRALGRDAGAAPAALRHEILDAPRPRGLIVAPPPKTQARTTT